jgi:phosphate starvation-inducible protein PhoH and related proteins
MEQTLHLDNAREAQDLAGPGFRLLGEISRVLGARLTARDTWIRMEGEAEAIERTAGFFELVRRGRNRGAMLRDQGVLYTLRKYAEGRAEELERLYTTRLEVAPGRPPVFPRTFGQLRYVEAIARNDVTFGIGPAGTGKTYLAMAMAVGALLRGDVSRIILTRPAIEAGEALGFLPGDLQQKVYPYLRPLRDALYDMMPAEEIERSTERGVIEVAPLAYMRGRTLNHAFVILDEAQNTTEEQMLMFLTRLGFDARCVVNGDLTQVDLPPKKTSGLLEAFHTLGAIEGLSIQQLDDTDVVRHELVQKIILAYRQGRGTRPPRARK